MELYLTCLITSSLLLAYTWGRYGIADAIRQYGTVQRPNHNPETQRGLKNFYPKPEEFNGMLTSKGRADMFVTLLLMGIVISAFNLLSLFLMFHWTSVPHHVNKAWMTPIFFYSLAPVFIISEIRIRWRARRRANQA